jgi:hypothetical protein
MSNDLTAIVARAIRPLLFEGLPDGECGPSTARQRKETREQATAALAAIRAEGLAILPRETSPIMEHAAMDLVRSEPGLFSHGYELYGAARIYRAMVEAGEVKG